ncbi:MAG: serine/threonine protein kinase, partial [Myxococcales bacterium]|nr:serine/threonine protein kinase [Myxococcales bacterium]
HIGWDALRRIFHQIVSALQCAHEAEIVHHDVKPTNIMIQKVAGDPYFVKLLDFGLAKLYEFRAQSGSFAGTPRYIAPEQIRGSDVGPWTDLYSVATILFELCTGRILNPGDSPDAMLWRRESMDFRLEAGALHDAALVRGLAPFFDRALARDPFDRFHDATAFREAMDRAFDLLTVGMSPETLSQNILAVCDGAPEEAQNPHGPMFETSVRRVPRTFSLRDVGRYESEARVAVPHAFVDVSSRGQGLVELPATIQPAVAVHDTGLSGTARATGEFRRREAHPIWRAVMIVSGVIATALLVVAIQEHRSTLSPRSFSDADVPAPRGESSDARSFASPPPRVGVRVERPQRSVVHPDEPPNRRDRLTRALVPEQRRGPADEAWRTSRRRERNLELRHTRSPRQTTVYVSTNPAGAELYLGGEYAGLSPKRLTFPGKTANLVVYAKGFATLRLTLSGGRPTLKLNLRQR